MANSVMQLVSDGSLNTIPLTIKFFEQAHIKVSVDGALLPANGYSYAWSGANTITITPAVALGLKVDIRRQTPADYVLHDFQAGAVFSETSIDENFRQDLFLLQEAREQSVVTDLYYDLDMHGNKVRNLGAAVLGGDATPLSQVQQIVSASGGNPFVEAQLLETARRSYAEAGYNVVGTFQAGFTYVNANDVGIDKTTGKGYTGPVGPVAPGTDPTSGGFVDKSNQYCVFNVKSYGAVGDGVTDDTLAIQAVLDLLGDNGGELYFPSGTYIVSMALSNHPYSCLQIGPNTTVRGENRRSTIITRPASERATDGVLIVNKGYDLPQHGGNYSAAGGIEITSIGITDGAATPNRGLGDLIGFGNGDGLLVHNCWFGNHDQHAIDIDKSRNVMVFNNKNENKVTAEASATYQIDAGLIWGISGGPTPTYNVHIHDNVQLGSYATNSFVHFHSGNIGKNIRINNNLIYLSNSNNDIAAIGGDADCTYENVSIHDNTIIAVDTKLMRAINLPTNRSSLGKVKNLKIYNNTITGTGRAGIYVGLGATTATDFNDCLDDVEIYGNTITYDSVEGHGKGVLGIAVYGFKEARIHSNTIRINTRAVLSNELIGIYCDNVLNVRVENNEVYESGSLTSFGDQYRYPIRLNCTRAMLNGLHSTVHISDNKVNMKKYRYGVSFVYTAGSEPANWRGISGTISGNTILGEVQVAHIWEIAGLSDGTNNGGFVDFTGIAGVDPSNPYILKVAKATHYKNLPMVGKAMGRGSAFERASPSFKVYFATTSESLSTDSEEVNVVHLGDNKMVGMHVVNINGAQGTFDIITGSDGVRAVITDGTLPGKPIGTLDIALTGSIKVWNGI